MRRSNDMGLDIYLYLEDKDTGTIIEYSYYRKFNALQGYFERTYNLDNGERILLDLNQINDIFMRLNEVRYAPELAPELLPTQPGPFYGTYEYDRLYYEYVKQASTDFYHAKYIDFEKYNLYFTSDW